MCVCVRVCMYAFVCMYVCMYVCMHACMRMGRCVMMGMRRREMEEQDAASFARLRGVWPCVIHACVCVCVYVCVFMVHVGKAV